jgi:hypothetical protein
MFSEPKSSAEIPSGYDRQRWLLVHNGKPVKIEKQFDLAQIMKDAHAPYPVPTNCRQPSRNYCNPSGRVFFNASKNVEVLITPEDGHQTPVEHQEEVPVEHLEEVPVEHLEEVPVEHQEEVPVEHLEEVAVEHLEKVAVEHLEKARSVNPQVKGRRFSPEYFTFPMVGVKCASPQTHVFPHEEVIRASPQTHVFPHEEVIRASPQVSGINTPVHPQRSSRSSDSKSGIPMYTHAHRSPVQQRFSSDVEENVLYSRAIAIDKQLRDLRELYSCATSDWAKNNYTRNIQILLETRKRIQVELLSAELDILTINSNDERYLHALAEEVPTDTEGDPAYEINTDDDDY